MANGDSKWDRKLLIPDEDSDAPSMSPTRTPLAMKSVGVPVGVAPFPSPFSGAQSSAQPPMAPSSLGFSMTGGPFRTNPNVATLPLAPVRTPADFLSSIQTGNLFANKAGNELGEKPMVTPSVGTASPMPAAMKRTNVFGFDESPANPNATKEPFIGDKNWDKFAKWEYDKDQLQKQNPGMSEADAEHILTSRYGKQVEDVEKGGSRLQKFGHGLKEVAKDVGIVAVTALAPNIMWTIPGTPQHRVFEEREKQMVEQGKEASAERAAKTRLTGSQADLAESQARKAEAPPVANGYWWDGKEWKSMDQSTGVEMIPAIEGVPAPPNSELVATDTGYFWKAKVGPGTQPSTAPTTATPAPAQPTGAAPIAPAPTPTGAIPTTPTAPPTATAGPHQLMPVGKKSMTEKVFVDPSTGETFPGRVTDHGIQNVNTNQIVPNAKEPEKHAEPKINYDQGNPVSITTPEGTFDVNSDKIPDKYKSLVARAMAAHQENQSFQEGLASTRGDAIVRARDEQQATAMAKKSTETAVDTETNYKRMMDIYNDIKKTGKITGPQAMAFLSSHIAMTFGGVPGVRTGEELIQWHLKARDLPSDIEAAARSIIQGGPIAMSQVEGFMDLANKTRAVNWTKAIYSAQEANQQFGSKIKPPTMPDDLKTLSGFGGEGGGGGSTTSAPKGATSEVFAKDGKTLIGHVVNGKYVPMKK